MTNQQPPFGGGFPQPGSGNPGSGGSSAWGSGSSAADSPWGSPGQSAPAPTPSTGGASSPWGSPSSAGTGAVTDPFAPAKEGDYSGPLPGAPGSAEPAGGAPLEPSSAPATWLVPGLALGIIALVMAAILLLGDISPISGTYAGMAFGAWALAGLVGVSSLAFYFSEDTRRRANGMYSIVGWKQGLYWATLAVLLIAIILSSLCIALWVGRL